MYESLQPELGMLLRVFFASLLGFMIGIERRGGPRGAGPRTFSLICLGSAFFSVLAVVSFPAETATARVVGQIVTGVGFIGAGVIWRQEGDILHGITTAAAIWVSAAVGLSVGLGYFVVAFFVAVMAMFILARGHPIEEAKKHICTE
ncbi:MAG: MgtC/SapB family protein [Candidatus Altiarchaeales archaeon]|nr:MgtC/SapB family protein [Candidatus Altiarchaeales archaeon]MBD3415607.1 MgtC/SapB family protein [Candidatus Altiarchaeales archaeon]